MRIWSSLLLVTFSGVLSAAPAAPLAVFESKSEPPATRDPSDPAAPANPADPADPKEKKQQPVIRSGVVLRGSDHQDRAATSAGGGPEPTFVDTAPALRARHLGRVWRPQAPIDSSAGADLRAGLIATPPPAA